MVKGSVWLSMSVVWVAYALTWTGYVWLRGYNVTFSEAVDPLNFYQGSWPPGKIPSGTVFPSKTAASG